MILDLRTLKRNGLDESDFFFEYVPEVDFSDILSVTLDGAVQICGTVSLTGNHSAYVEGEIKCTFKGECTRCLKETVKDFVFDFAEQLEQGTEQGYSVVNDRIDLTKIVVDAICMNLPVNFLCKDDCKGICAGCGVNLNDEQCKCEK